MSDKESEKNTSSDEESNRTIVNANDEILELRNIIKNLQISLAASESEKLRLKHASNQHPIVSSASDTFPDALSSNSIFSGVPFTSIGAACAQLQLPCVTSADELSAGAACAVLQLPSVNSANQFKANVPAVVAYTSTTAASANFFDTAHPSALPASLRYPNAALTSAANASCSSASFANVSTDAHFNANTQHPVNSTNASFASVNNSKTDSMHPYFSLGRNVQPPPNLPPQTWTPQTCQQFARKLIDLPDFNGSPEAWPLFSTAFKETTSTYYYTDLENLFRLQKALKGTARERVESLLIHPSSVSAVMSALEFHYGRPELLIRSQIAKARSFPVVTNGRLSEIINLSTMVSNSAAFLENAGAVPHLNNPTLLDELVSKLPLNKKEEWIRHTFSIKQPYPSVREFSNWLQQIAMFISMATEVVPTNSSPNDSFVQRYNKSSKSVSTVIANKLKCSFCNEEHHLYQCLKFKEEDTARRWEFVKLNGLCFSCLRGGHNMQSCIRRRECGISSCRYFHNRLLHNPTSDSNDENTNTKKAVATVSACQTVQNKSAVLCDNNNKINLCKKTLLKYLPVTLSGPNGSLNVIAFIDDGAMVSLMEEKVADFLGLNGKAESLSLKWIGNQTSSEKSRQVNVEIAGAYADAEKFQMKGVRTTKKLFLTAQTLLVEEFSQKYNELKNVPIGSYKNAMPKILIGIPHTNLMRALNIINFDEGFTAHQTKLGWILFGSNEIVLSEPIVGHVQIENILVLELQKEITDYFNCENFEPKPLPSVKSKADERAERILKETTQLVDGKYETGLLWNSDDFEFTQSYDMALKRLELIEKKMLKSLEFAEWYTNKIEEYIAKSYARKLSPAEAAFVNGRTWYLPHFVVYNINKGNKPRLVFDAAAKVNGMSLNCVLMKGPDEYQPKSLLSILFKFRQGKIAVCGDIREMFNRVNIRKEDQNAQRFLWRRGDQSKPPEVYIMNAMIFGSICSPCSAQYCKNLNAEKYRIENPRAFEAIVNRHYVDDFVDSFNTAEEAADVTLKIIEIHSSAGFELRGFVSNSKQLLQTINKSSKTSQESESKNMCHSESVDEKILGMHWNPQIDKLYFNLSFSRVPKAVLDGSRRPTKAEMLSVLMSIFDPFGLLSNILVLPKILMQRLWQYKIDWHEQIPDEIYDKWFQWYTNLHKVKEFNIPRCYHPEFTNPDVDIQLHIFTDASELAFSAVAYWRVRHYDDVQIIFAAGRSRCCPIKSLSIPRLELQSAVLGVRLKNAVLQNHDISPKNTVFWSDSKTVIQWIHSDARRYKQFVSHRISEILQSSDVKQWRWVPGSQNPADDATRPQVEQSFSSRCRWVSGPIFLKNGEADWPLLPNIFEKNEGAEEQRCSQLYAVQYDDSVIPFNKFSNYYNFLKVMTWVRYAISKFRNLISAQAVPQSEPTLLTATEIKLTEIMLCRLVQESVFPDEIELLQKGVAINKSSSLRKLSPVLDESGVLRLGGRIDNATCVPDSVKRPIILPKSHPMTHMIVQHYHQIFYHQNQEAILCAIRYKFWIPNIRRLIKMIKTKCQVCKNLSAVPETPLMGQIPEDRLIPLVRPFSYSGVDYFGPFFVSIGRRREKRWVALFTCLTIRAIHLELAKDLSTEAAILCLRNFINRRGVPVRLRSDRGTNFVGASKEEWLHIERDIGKECARRGIEWVFNTPADPSAGGCWERMVRSVKRVLSFTLKEHAPQVETFRSLLIEAENLINSRPLTHVPIESVDAEPLSPNHFLLGCQNYVQTSCVPEKGCLRKQWHTLQQLKQTFWKRWMLEYLPTLTRRTKWHQKVEPLKIGDVVLVCDDNESRGQWKRGRIVEVFPALDGQVRSALVKTQFGTLRRPASKLAVLDVIGESPPATSSHGREDVVE